MNAIELSCFISNKGIREKNRDKFIYLLIYLYTSALILQNHLICLPANASKRIRYFSTLQLLQTLSTGVYLFKLRKQKHGPIILFSLD